MTRNAELLAMREQSLAAHVLKRCGGGCNKWVGRVVKVGFDTGDERVTKEWMWVRVEAAHSGRLVGVLANRPAFVDLEFGDPVIFTEDEIVAAHTEEARA